MVCVRRASLDVHFSFRHLTLIRASFFSLAPVGRTFFFRRSQIQFHIREETNRKKTTDPVLCLPLHEDTIQNMYIQRMQIHIVWSWFRWNNCL